VGGEIRNPGRAIPIALIAGVGIVAALYISLNAAVQYAMPATRIATSEVPASAAAQVALGSRGTLLVLLGMGLSMLVTLNGSIMSGGRIPFAVARDGYFFKTLAVVHPRFHTPSSAIVVQAIMAIIFLLGGGAFKDFFNLAIFSEWLFYMLAASTIFVFRRRDADKPRPYSAWGYPIVPALFVGAAAVVLYYTFTDSWAASWKRTLAVSLIILGGVPVFWYFARRRQTAA
jgi:basic amino acid/polyamine antiporter, APA family